MRYNKIQTLALLGFMTAGMAAAVAPRAETVQVELETREVDLPIDNKGTLYPTWTFNGTVPGPVVRVTEGDTVEFTLTNAEDSKNSHSIDFHAASGLHGVSYIVEKEGGEREVVRSPNQSFQVGDRVTITEKKRLAPE